MYQQIILEHAKARHGDGLNEAPEGCSHGESMQHNPVCGDQIRLRVQLEGTTLKDISWEGDGCSISMASASVLSEMASGLERDEFIGILEEFRELMRSRGAREANEEILGDAAAFAGVSKFPARVKCAMLSWVAAEAALLAANSQA
nr:SUF system NifU family Fe-S cluster assembly protein [Paeniglutamicibacter kerguelensis]